MVEEQEKAIQKIWEILSAISDPEIPVLTLTDLGIIRDVKLHNNNHIEVIITLTYNGCPAMDFINSTIKLTLIQNGYTNVKVTTVLSPAWTTDWITENGKQKLKEYGIAPPTTKQTVCNTDAFVNEEAIQCPRCNSYSTNLISKFGSTPCKALYQCNDCKEPFDYFKCH